MAMNFTQDQQKVIDIRGKNILVSASAGSGKTAVLVARIMKKVCEEGIDIDGDVTEELEVFELPDGRFLYVEA